MPLSTEAEFEEMYRCYPSESAAALAKCIGDKIDFRTSGSDQIVPWAGAYEGVEGFAEFGKRVAEHFDITGFEIVERIVELVSALFLVRLKTVVKKSGEQRNILATHSCRLEEDGTVLFREIYDTREVAPLL